MSLDSPLPGTLKIHSTTTKSIRLCNELWIQRWSEQSPGPNELTAPAPGILKATCDSNQSVHLPILSELKAADLKICPWPMGGARENSGRVSLQGNSAILACWYYIPLNAFLKQCLDQIGERCEWVAGSWQRSCLEKCGVSGRHRVLYTHESLCLAHSRHSTNICSKNCCTIKLC